MKSLLLIYILFTTLFSFSDTFPAVIPSEKPDFPMSVAMERLYDEWNPHEDRGNELYSNFKYTPLKGFKDIPFTSRRDPTKVIKKDGIYHVWYTRRTSACDPAGLKNSTESIPATDWDLADIWHAVSSNGIDWVEDKAPSVKRPPMPEYGSRSICTPGILVWKNRFYLYFQAYAPRVGGTEYCPVRVAHADSPFGPWTHHSDPVILPGTVGSWNNIKINDPCPIVYKDKIYIYYKGAPIERGNDYIIRMQGVSISSNPFGPFVESNINPIINSGHETCMFPWKEGVAALVALDGPEKNTIQYAADGEHFFIVSKIQVPPVAPGPFCEDAFLNSGDGKGFLWGLCHINPDGGGAVNKSILARFDCDLSLDVDQPDFKRNNLRFNKQTYLQSGVGLSQEWKTKIKNEQKEVDRETIH